jgi:methylated-DNA-protein-cysteine methyltransferase-like protein
MHYVPPPNKKQYYEQVWAAVRRIPSGRVATYGQITQMLAQPEGISLDDYSVSAARWVGLAMASCPDDVPWQRVINSQGKISHRAEHGKQKKLLQEEGVHFENEKINLDDYQWREHEPGDRPRQGRLF